MIEIKFFRFFQNCPVEEFLNTLTSKQAQKVAWVMQLIEELEKVPEQYFKKLSHTEDIWEIRIQQGSNIFRILGFLSIKNVLLQRMDFRKKRKRHL